MLNNSKEEKLGSSHVILLGETAQCTTQEPIAPINVVTETRATNITFETALSAPVEVQE
jgi:hypothetical protein